MPLRSTSTSSPSPSTSTPTSSSSSPSNPTPNSTTTTSQPPNLPSTFTDAHPLPKLLVFDLDYTLWPFWVDTHCSPPFRSVRNGKAAKDRTGHEYGFYAEVPSVLAACKWRGVKVAAASRTETPDDARSLLRLLTVPVGDAEGGDSSTGGSGSRSVGADGVENGTNGNKEGKEQKREPAISFFDNLQIFPGNKVTHLTRIRKEFSASKGGKEEGIEFKDMLFFDDESRNRNVERELGVKFVMVHNGVSRAVVDQAVREWRRERGFSGVEREDGEVSSKAKGRGMSRAEVDVVLDE